MGESEPAAKLEIVQSGQAGDPPSQEDVFSRYAQRLVRLAEQQLSSRLAGRLSGEDVVQSALRSFFSREARGEFSIDSSSQLWRLLVKITLNKARAKARHHTAEIRDVRAEAPDGGAQFAHLAAREPGPDEAVALVDQVGDLLRGLPDIYGQILRMRLEGHGVADVASELGISRQTVYRTLQLFQQRLTKDAEKAAGQENENTV